MPVAVEDWGGLPESATARARYVSELMITGSDCESFYVLTALAAHDVSWRVRAAAARHTALPRRALHSLARDRVPRVRRAALGALAARGDDDVEELASMETCALSARAGLGTTSGSSDSSGGTGGARQSVALRLLEHGAAVVRLSAARTADAHEPRARELLADSDAGVRACARERVVEGAVPLSALEVRRFVRDGALLQLCKARCETLQAYVAALHAVEDVCDSADVRTLVLRHIEFARAYDLLSLVEDRIVPWAVQNSESQMDM